MSDKLKKILVYTGIASAIISAIAYLVVTYVIVVGFESSVDMQKQILFSILGSFIGLLITFSLRTQGITFARKEDKSKQVMKEYYDLINKKKTVKQLHTIKHFMVWQTIKDIFSKGISIAGSTYMVMYIFANGNGNFGLFALAISNILMFAGFGIVALSKAYDKYLEEHIPVMEQIIERLKKDLKIKDDFKHSDELIQVIKNKIDQTRSIESERVKENVNIQEHKLLVTSTTSQ